MHRLKKLLPSPSMIIALLALLIATSGVAVAATLITSADIKDNTIRSRDVRDNTLKSGDVRDATLELVDLSDAAKNALKGTPTPPTPTAAWSASTYAQINNVTTGGTVARMTFTSPIAGYAVVHASFAARTRQPASTDCRVSAQISGTSGAPDAINPGATSAPGFIDQWVNGNLPTQMGAGTYLGLNMSGSRVLPVVAGSNTVYLNGRHSCNEVYFGPITMTAVLVKDNPAATISAN